MIPLQFGLFWCGGSISYLRYLTFKSLRHYHPEANIELYISKRSNNKIHNWGVEKQDFEGIIEKDYTNDIRDIGVKIIEIDYFSDPNYCPIYQADLFRFWWLYHKGGFYMDTDQLVLKSLSELSLDKDFIYSQFANKDRTRYAPTGILGCSKNNIDAQTMMGLVPQGYASNNYNSSGPFVFEYALSKNIFKTSLLNVPSSYFYPIDCSSDIYQVYQGNYVIPKESLCLHWYGGHPLSQAFNKTYNRDVAMQGNDSISKYLRSEKII